MNRNNKNKYRIVNSGHIKNIFEKDYYLDLGIIDTNIITKLLKYEVVDMNDIAFQAIQNKSILASSASTPTEKQNLPYIYFRKIQQSNPNLQLVITYGLYFYRDYEKKDKFAPIIFIPITVYYEEGKTLVKMISRPFENKGILNNIKNSKIQMIESESLKDIYSLDNVLFTLEKIKKGSVRTESYLTIVERKRDDLNVPDKKKYDYSFIPNKKLEQKTTYYSHKFTREQKNVLERALLGDNVTFSGYSGTGKTTVLKSIIINTLCKKQNILYLSNAKESVDNVYKFLTDYNLGSITRNLYNKTNIPTDFTKEDLPVENISEIITKIEEAKQLLDSYEQVMNKKVNDYKLVEIIHNLFKLKDFDKLNTLDSIPKERLNFLYKKEINKIYSSLAIIEYNSSKIKSFKNSVWKEIPYNNDIPYVNAVINVLFLLNNGLRGLVEQDIVLQKYGFKKITKYSEFKRIIYPILSFDKNVVPVKWLQDYNSFKLAEDTFEKLSNSIKEYQYLEYDLSTKYININQINASDEIKILYSDIFTEKQNSNINNIINNINTLLDYANSSLQCIDTFNELSSKLLKILDVDEKITSEICDKIISLGLLLENNVVTSKMFNEIANNNDGKFCKDLEEIYMQIKANELECEKLVKDYPRTFKNMKKKLEDINVKNYLNLKKQNEKLINNYQEITDVTYDNHSKLLESIRQIKKYYLNIINNNHHSVILKYLKQITDTSKKSYVETIISFIALIKKIKMLTNEFKKYGFIFDDDKIVENVEILKKYSNYILSVKDSQDRIINFKIDKGNSLVLIDEYYKIKNIQENFEQIVYNLRNNSFYKETYDFLYESEQTKLNHIKDVINMYSVYIDLFNTKEEGLNSVKDIDTLKEQAKILSNQISNIESNLRLYNKVFKNGVNRYYYQNIEENIEYLSYLLENKESLTHYLNITKELKTLNEESLFDLIDYIVTTDDLTHLKENVMYTYYTHLINQMCSSYPVIKDTKKYMYTLNQYNELVTRYITNKNNQIINSIKQNVINNKFKKDVKIYLANVQQLEEYLKKVKFDIVLVDDAHLISEGKYENIITGKQVIICGDYQANNVAIRNLLAQVMSANTSIFRNRFVVGPRRLTYNMTNTKAPYLTSYEDNNGVEVYNGNYIVDQIYNIYKRNKNHHINYYIKNFHDQYIAYDLIATYFISKNVSLSDTYDFINNCLNIIGLDSCSYIHSDYDILTLEDYYTENSPIVSNDYIAKIIQNKKKLIIYDNNCLLDGDYHYNFFEKIKEIVNYNKIFLNDNPDDITSILANEFTKRGYEVYYPSNGINFTIKHKGSNMLYSVVILYSNGFITNISGNYNFLTEVYKNKGHHMIIKTMMDLKDGPVYFTRKICEEINGKRK